MLALCLISAQAFAETFLYWPGGNGATNDNQVSIFTQNYKKGVGLTYNNNANPHKFRHTIVYDDATSHTPTTIPTIGMQGPGFQISNGELRFIRGASKWNLPWYEHCAVFVWSWYAYLEENGWTTFTIGSSSTFPWFDNGWSAAEESQSDYQCYVSGWLRYNGVNFYSSTTNHHEFHNADYYGGVSYVWSPQCYNSMAGGSNLYTFTKEMTWNGGVETITTNGQSTVEVEMPHMSILKIGGVITKLNLSPLPGCPAPSTYTEVLNAVNLRYHGNTGNLLTGSRLQWDGNGWVSVPFGNPSWNYFNWDIYSDTVSFNERHIVWYGQMADQLAQFSNVRESLTDYLAANGLTTVQPAGATAVGEVITYAVVETDPPVPAFQGTELAILGQVHEHVFQVAASLGTVLMTVPVYEQG